MIRTPLFFSADDAGLIPDRGTEMPQAAQRGLPTKGNPPCQNPKLVIFPFFDLGDLGHLTALAELPTATWEACSLKTASQMCPLVTGVSVS